MEGEIHQDRALLDPPEVHAQVLDLPLLLLAELLAPNFIVFDVNILDKSAIEIGTVFVVIFGPLELVVGGLREFLEAA